MPSKGLVLLLDYSPQFWRSLDDYHFLLCKRLKEQDIEPIMVYSRAIPDDVRRRVETSGAIVEVNDFGQGILSYYHHLQRIVRQRNVQLAHVCFFDYFSPVAWLARLSGVRRIVFYEQNSGIPRATSWRRFLLLCRSKAMTFPLMSVIAMSDFVRQTLISMGIDQAKISLAPGGVDTERFAPDPEVRCAFQRDYQIEPDELILAAVAFLLPWKHPEVLVEACALLDQRGIRTRLFIAGDGPLEDSLKELTRTLAIEARVHWMGRYPTPEKLYQACDIYLLASVGEAFGVVLTEAQSCGAPVVASRSGGIPEIIDDGRTGLLATPLDPSSFADAIERLARNPALRTQMGRSGRQRMIQHFTVEKSVEKTLAVYETMWRR